MSVAIVTGGGTGVGRGICLALGRAGFSVVVAAHHADTGEATAADICAGGGQAVAVTTDVTVLADIEGAVRVAVEHYGQLDAFVQNAVSSRSSQPMALESASPDIWRDHAAVSITAVFHGARIAYPHLVASGGSMLVLQSPAGIQGSAELSFYATVKGFQRGLVKSLAREWAPDGVRVNGLAPLAVSPALEAAFQADPAMETRLAAVVPSGRLGDPESDIGPAAVFLCSPAARYVTGQTLVVSGGRFTAL